MNKNLLFYTVMDNNKVMNKTLLQILFIIAGIATQALLSQISIPLPFTPVPITGQTLGVFAIGFLYGSKLGFITLLSYFILGSLGMPIFAGGHGGLPLFSASGGYLIGQVLATIFCGYFAEKGCTKSFFATLLVMLGASVVLYAFGLFQLSFFLSEGQSLLMAGLYPFIIGDIIKALIVAFALPSCWKIKQKLFPEQ